MHALGRYSRLSSQTFASLGATTLWEDYKSKLFKELAQQKREDIAVGGKDSGYVYHINDDDASKDELDNVATNYNFNIESKRFTPYIDQGIKAQFSHVDIFTTQVDNSLFSIDLFENEDTNQYKTKTLNLDGSSPKVWKRINVSHIANAHKFKLYLSNDQLNDDDYGTVIFRVHAFKLSFKPAGQVRLS